MCVDCLTLLDEIIRKIFFQYKVSPDVSTFFFQLSLLLWPQMQKLLRQWIGHPVTNNLLDSEWTDSWSRLFCDGAWIVCWHSEAPCEIHTYTALDKDGSYRLYNGHSLFKCYGSRQVGHKGGR